MRADTIRPDTRCMVYNYQTKEAVQPCNLSYKDAEHALDIGQTQVRVVLEKRGCYSWSAKVFSTLSPYVQLYAPEDLATIKHQMEYDDLPHPVGTEKCEKIQAVTFVFQGNVEWIRLFIQPSTEAAPALTDTFEPGSGSASLLKKLAQKAQSKSEAGGATNVQVGWTPSFTAPQKVNVYSNVEYLFNIPNAEQNRNQWIGISSLIDRNNGGAQNPDSTINTLEYMAFLPTPRGGCDKHDRTQEDNKNKTGDIYDCGGVEVRPAILTFKIGAEYALDTGALNQINSLGVRLPVAFTKSSAITVTPTFGFEAGRNFETESDLHVSSDIFRWLVGTDASYRFRPYPTWLLGTKPYTLSGTFRARFPRTNEEFSTIYNNATQYSADTRTRIYGKAQLSIPLSKILALSVNYQYGDLPPAFLFFGHTLTLSLTAASPTDYEH
jgi:hypothetical protein